MNALGSAAAGRVLIWLLWCTVGLLALQLSPAAGAEGADLRFERLFTDAEAAGQGVGAIRAIVQDKLGFIWLGGENGLARYDGVRLKRYLSDPRVGNTLTSSYVRDLVIDADGVMWVATDLGLCRYNATTDDFTAFVQGEAPGYISHNVVTSLAVDGDNRLYLGTGDGLTVLDPPRQRFSHYAPQPSPDEETGVFSVQAVYIDRRNRVWLGTAEQGLALFDPQSQHFQIFQHNPRDPTSVIADSVLSIHEDRRGRLWVGTYGGGLSRMNADGRSFTNYTHSAHDSSSIGASTIWDIYEDSAGDIWFATDPGGLGRYDESADAFVRYRHKPYNRDSISSNAVRTVFEDASGDLWIGAFPSGVNFYNRGISQFRNFTHTPDDANSLSHSAVLAFIEDRQGLVWIGSEGGLDAFDKATQTFTRHNLRPGEAGGLRANAVLSIAEDATEDLWLGTWSGGLHRYNRRTGIFKNYFPDKNKPGSINSGFIWALHRDRDNNLWIGTETGGLNLYDRATDSFTAFVHDPANKQSISGNFVWAILEDRQGYLWVGTTNGLDRLDRRTRTFRRYTEGASDPQVAHQIIRVRALAEDSQGRIWIGTQDNGAFIYDPDKDIYSRIDEKAGLPSPFVSSMVEDGLGNMWLTTGIGVARVALDTLAVTAYRRGHGLVGNNFNRNASLKDRDGHLYFGSAEGFSLLDPGQLTEPVAEFPVWVTDFRIFGRSVSMGAPDSPLQSSILTAPVITLDHTHSMFSFEFAALSYRFSARNHYAYMLEGFDKGWNYTGTDNSATYTNLGPGKYLFKARGANGDGTWSEQIASKRLIINPPPWKTWWAYLIYAAALVSLAAGAWKIKARQMEYTHQRALNNELVRVNEIKDTFLANTSHELRTPLNGIIGIAESLADNPLVRAHDDLFHRLNLIVFSGKRLSSLINDILDYSKLSERQLKIYPRPVDFRQLTEHVFQLLAPLAEAKQIELVNLVDPSMPAVHADENRLQQIMINLVGNGIKYSSAGSVTVACKDRVQFAEVVVADTGTGIPANQFDNVFKAFFQLEGSDSRRHGGTGLGLSVTRQLVELHGGSIRLESEEGAGSKFIFTLHYSPERQAQPPDTEPNTTLAATGALRKRAVGSKRGPRSALASVDDLELSPPPANAASFTLLIVDDDPVNRMVLSGILQLHNYAVLEAASGAEALQLLASAAGVDLVVLDVMMPEMNGYETCRCIRQTYDLHQLPVIFLTAKKVDADIARAFAAGGTEILTKPVSKYEILPRVANQLRLLEIVRESRGPAAGPASKH